MAQVSPSPDLLAVDDFYFSLLFDQNLNETEPVSDSKYAEELQLQEALISSAIASQTSSVITLLASVAPPPESINIVVGQSSQDFCEICFERKEPEEMFRSGSCDHSYCTDCITKYVGVKLQESIRRVNCPTVNCTGELRLDDCRPLLPKSVVERWEDALCESMILASRQFQCPFRDCSAMLVIEDEDGEEIRESECPYCHRLFCAKCNVPWHVGVDCGELKNLDEDERGRDDLLVRELAKEKRWGRCPRCKFYVERTEGCPHMTCRCTFEFCYGCGTAWDVSHGGCGG